MKFSILISAYNIENYIRKCIETCLEQTYKDYEIIVVNDCSTDKTKEILEEYSDKIKIINLPENRGLSYARNIAIKESKGDYICIYKYRDAESLQSFVIERFSGLQPSNTETGANSYRIYITIASVNDTNYAMIVLHGAYTGHAGSATNFARRLL